MAFDKNYPNRKDWRKPYRGAKAVDVTCRCHGTCPHCQGNRQHKNLKRQITADESLKEME